MESNLSIQLWLFTRTYKSLFPRTKEKTTSFPICRLKSLLASTLTQKHSVCLSPFSGLCYPDCSGCLNNSCLLLSVSISHLPSHIYLSQNNGQETKSCLSRTFDFLRSLVLAFCFRQNCHLE